jgi:hypothetical protein
MNHGGGGGCRAERHGCQNMSCRGVVEVAFAKGTVRNFIEIVKVCL